jgi:membrane protease YdiL (CAAX protease family)
VLMSGGRARAWIYACVVVLAGNAKVLLGNRSLAGDWRSAVMGVVISGLSLIYARRIGHTSWDELGLSPARNLPRSLGLGLSVVGALMLLSAIGARALRTLGMSVEPLKPEAPGDLAEISATALRRRLLVYLWFDTAIPEELVMRSVLFSELRPHVSGKLRRVMLSMAAFVAWHAYLGWSEVPDHNPRALSAKFGSYALGSLIFTAPFVATGHIAGSILAHWLTDCVLLLAGHPSGQWFKTIVILD